MAGEFDVIAGRLIAEIDAAEIGPATEVGLILHVIDRDGNPGAPIRESITPSVTVQGLGASAGQAFAASMLKGTIRDNVNATVRGLPTGFGIRSAGSPVPLKIHDVTLDIVHP